MATSPATAQINCFDRKAYGEPKRSRAITAEAENTITRPTNTSSMVTVNSQRSTLTRFAMGIHFTTEEGTRGGGIVDCFGSLRFASLSEAKDLMYSPASCTCPFAARTPLRMTGPVVTSRLRWQGHARYL